MPISLLHKKSIFPPSESKIFYSLQEANLKNLVPREKNNIADGSVQKIILPCSLLCTLHVLYPKAKIINHSSSLDKG